jgi:site-specific recombinase XerD
VLNGLLAPEAAAGIDQVPGAKQRGTRAGNWLTRDQAQALLDLPDPETLKGKRDRAVLSLLIDCALRRSEAAGLELADIQQREASPSRVAQVDCLDGLAEIDRDPFGRMLVAQALAEKYTLISRDGVLARYGAPVVWE